MSASSFRGLASEIEEYLDDFHLKLERLATVNDTQQEVLLKQAQALLERANETSKELNRIFSQLPTSDRYQARRQLDGIIGAIRRGRQELTATRQRASSMMLLGPGAEAARHEHDVRDRVLRAAQMVDGTERAVENCHTTARETEDLTMEAARRLREQNAMTDGMADKVGHIDMQMGASADAVRRMKLRQKMFRIILSILIALFAAADIFIVLYMLVIPVDNTEVE